MNTMNLEKTQGKIDSSKHKDLALTHSRLNEATLDVLEPGLINWRADEEQVSWLGVVMR